jgi:hypothetical protein
MKLLCCLWICLWLACPGVPSIATAQKTDYKATARTLEEKADELHRQNCVECLELYRDSFSQWEQENSPARDRLRVLEKMTAALRQGSQSSRECLCDMVRFMHVKDMQDLEILTKFLRSIGYPAGELMNGMDTQSWRGLLQEIADLPAHSDDEHVLKSNCFELLAGDGWPGCRMLVLAIREMRDCKVPHYDEEKKLLQTLLFAMNTRRDQIDPGALASSVARFAKIADKDSFEQMFCQVNSLATLERNFPSAESIQIETDVLERAKDLHLSSMCILNLTRGLGILCCAGHRHAEAERYLNEVAGQDIAPDNNPRTLHEQMLMRLVVRLCLASSYMKGSRLDASLTEIQMVVDGLNKSDEVDKNMLEPIATSLKASVEAKQNKREQSCKSAAAAKAFFEEHALTTFQQSEICLSNPLICSILPDELANLELLASLMQQEAPPTKTGELDSILSKIDKLRARKLAAKPDANPVREFSLADWQPPIDQQKFDQEAGVAIENLSQSKAPAGERIVALIDIADKAIEVCRFKVALSALQEGLDLFELVPNDPIARYLDILNRKVYVELLTGNIKAAEQDVDELEHLHHGSLDSDTAASKARLEQTKNQSQPLEQLLERAVTAYDIEKKTRESSFSEKANFELAAARYGSGKLFEAQKTLSAFLQSQLESGKKADLANASLLALVFYALNQKQLAETTMNQVLYDAGRCNDATTDNALVEFHAGQLAEKEGNIVRATRYYVAASEILDQLGLQRSPLAMRIKLHLSGKSMSRLVGLF